MLPMTDPFDDPGSTTAVQWEDHLGRLVLITPRESVPEFTTSYGTGPIIRADMVVLDGPTAPETFTDIIIFPKVLQGQVRANVGSGRSNLGRVGKGEKKSGQSAPWQLSTPSDADKRLARDYLAGKASAATRSATGRAGYADEPPF